MNQPVWPTRPEIRRLEDLPNVGRATAEDLRQLGIREPAELCGQDPRALYDRLCVLTHCRQDPCVLDVFLSAVRFMEGAPARPWWDYTPERKQQHPDLGPGKARKGARSA
ncbi:MAG: helix-hairpin-helix domain-containing protein [Candidatus Delongbacteria bacterium]